MAPITTKRRNKLPDSDFAIPENRQYPIDTRARAANALSRVNQFGTPAQKRQVKAAVCKRYSDLPACQS